MTETEQPETNQEKNPISSSPEQKVESSPTQQISSSPEQTFKRNIAFKLRIGSIIEGKQIIENERLKHLEAEGKEINRVNIIANVVDKFIQDGEKKFASITLDDATGQLRVKTFGEEIEQLSDINQGDTILVIGLLRTWNNELYMTPEIIKKLSPQYLLIRKLESDLNKPKSLAPEQSAELKDKILQLVKATETDEGIFIDKIILDTHEPPEIINSEIKKLLENGLVYEPRPGKLRYLG